MTEKKRHLIVMADDEEQVLRSLERLLRKSYDVQAFTSGAELLGSLDRLSPSLVIVDWMMPEIDGISLCNEIKKRRRFGLVPVAFFSAVDPSTENLEKAFQAGAQAFIPKGRSSAFFLAHVHTLIQGYERLMQYLGQQKMMLSVLRHDMSNLLTGVITALEVLTMHPAFEENQLKRQADIVLRSSRNLRLLFADLSEVLFAVAGKGAGIWQVEKVSGIFEDVRGYADNMMREAVFEDAGSLEVRCNRGILGRCLYYMVRFVDKHMPPDLQVSVKAENGEKGMIFTISVQGGFKEAFEAAVSAAEDSSNADSSHDILFVQYIKNVLLRHGADISIVEEQDRTGVRFVLPD